MRSVTCVGLSHQVAASCACKLQVHFDMKGFIMKGFIGQNYDSFHKWYAGQVQIFVIHCHPWVRTVNHHESQCQWFIPDSLPTLRWCASCTYGDRMSALRFRRKSILYTRFGLGILTHNVVTFFGAKFPQPVENSRAPSLATILVAVTVVRP